MCVPIAYLIFTIFFLGSGMWYFYQRTEELKTQLIEYKALMLLFKTRERELKNKEYFNELYKSNTSSFSIKEWKNNEYYFIKTR